MKIIFILFFYFSITIASNIDSLITNFYFESNVQVVHNGIFNFSKDLNISSSYWALETIDESDVFHAILEYFIPENPDNSYEIRIGKGGQIYSFISSFGESVPPQWRHPNWVEPSYGGGTDYAPWVDEVWQMVAVDGSLHNPPDSSYFIHQAGVYLKTESQTSPFYSPIVAEFFDENNESYTVVNWGQQAHTEGLEDSGFKSNLLYYTKYTNIGNGILQVDNMMYNFGNDNIDFINIPWGGVRNSSLDNFFISNEDNTFDLAHAVYGAGPVVQTASTGGWMGWANDSLGASSALGMAHPLRTNTNNSVFRYGEAGNLSASWNNRDYNVFEMIRFPSNGQLGFGKSMIFRYFYILGNNMDSIKSTVIQNNLVQASLDTAFTADKFSVDSIYYHFSLNGNEIIANANNEQRGLVLRSIPYADSYPLFNISSSEAINKITTEPYIFSEYPWDGSLISIKLLGFLDKPTNLEVLNDTIIVGDSYTFSDGTQIDDILFNLSYISSNEDLYSGFENIIYTNLHVIQEYLVGDVNKDFYVNILDIILIVQFILGQIPDEEQAVLADWNFDNDINIEDCVQMVQFLLNQ